VKFVLDTNTLIYFFKGQGRVAEHLLGVSPREIGIPAVVLYELELGIARSSQPRKRRSQLDAMLSAVSVLPFDGEAARHAAELRATLDAAGKPIGPMDTLIAGTAIAAHGLLVTRNTGEFSRVKGLRLADWF
jgi:tRNA(fMet)-specific endonuclease VapC